MNKQVYIGIITRHLATITSQVELSNSVRLYDINILCEDFYKGLLNLIYSLNLTNLNVSESNAKAIDLGDKEKRVCIQVTSDTSLKKINATIQKFEEDKRQKDYDTLIVLMLKKKNKYRTLPQPVGYRLEVKDYKDLIKTIATLETDRLEPIVVFLDKELIDAARKRQDEDRKLMERFSVNAERYIAEVAETIVASQPAPPRDPNLNTEELREKFRRMKCSPTYKRGFERNAAFFPAVNQIISSDAVDGGANTIKALIGIIQSIYTLTLDQCANGDLVHARILGTLLKPQCTPEHSMATEVMLYYTVDGCGIFNETK